MPKPQQPELRRSGKGSTSDDGTELRAAGQDALPQPEVGGKVPAANRPGHRPPKDQDKPGPERLKKPRPRASGGKGG